MASRARSGERAAVVPTSRWRDWLRALRATRLARAAVAHEHRTAAGLFALLVLVYLWPALVQAKPLLAAAVLYQVAPWQGLAPADVLHYFNAELIDVPLSYYPWDVLARQLIHAGTFPAWNPYAFAGTPFFANPEVAWFSPFSLPLWILPLNYGLGVAAAFKLWMAGFGTYLLVRELRLGFWPGILAGTSFALCAFDVVWLSLGVHVAVAVLLPWTILLVERVLRRGRPVDGLALAGMVGFVLTGGHPGTQLHVLSAAVLYALARAVTSADTARRDRLTRLAMIGAALVVGSLVAAITLLPAANSAVDTAGALARRNGAAGFPGSTLPFGVLRAALFPDWWGRPSESGPGGLVHYSEHAFYAGGAAAVLAVVALVCSGGWRRKAPFALLGGFGLAVALRAPGIYPAVVRLPLFDRVQNQRILLLFAFAIAVLAAFGLQTILDAPRRRWHAWGVVAAAALAAAGAVMSVPTGDGALGKALHYMLHRSGDVTGGVLPLASVGWFLIFVVALAALMGLAAWRPERRRLVGGLVALLAAFDMLHFAHGYQSMGPAARAIPPRTPAIQFLQRRAALGRIAGVRYTLPNDWSTVYGLRDARGYDAPQPSLRFDRLWRTMSPEQTMHTAYAFPSLAAGSQRILSLLGTRYVLANPGTSAPTPTLSRVYRGTDATIFANALAMPRAVIASRVRVAANEDEEVAGLLRDDFDPRRDGVVRSHELGRTPPPRGGGGGTVRVVAETNATVTLRATLSRPGLVILDDAWAPGWSVRVDGRSARALQADMVLRGVVVAGGTHEIAWSYRVPGLRLGIALSAIGLLLVLAWAAWIVAWRRRSPP